jgi:hypothetical protein
MLLRDRAVRMQSVRSIDGVDERVKRAGRDANLLRQYAKKAARIFYSQSRNCIHFLRRRFNPLKYVGSQAVLLARRCGRAPQDVGAGAKINEELSSHHQVPPAAATGSLGTIDHLEGNVRSVRGAVYTGR